MRIVLLNWAKIWDGAGHGGGANGYCQSLALALVERGHEVVSLFGGRTYVPAGRPGGARGPCSIRRHEDWLGVKVFEVINSPVMAPSIVQFQDPLGELSAPELEAEIGRLLAILRPDVVHVHNIEGFSIGCIEEARKAGARVVFSLHNYHTICPQVYLMQGHRRVCRDSDNGHNCAGCIKTKTPREERRLLEAGYLKGAGDGPGAAELTQARQELEREWGGFKHEFSWPMRVGKGVRRLLALRAAVRRAEGASGRRAGAMPGHVADSSDSVHRALPYPESRKDPAGDKEGNEPVTALPGSVGPSDHRGQTQFVLNEINAKPLRVDVESPERLPLLNIVQPDPPSGKPPNEYGRRRAAMVGMLNSCDRVLAVSDFVRDKFMAMGVQERVVRTMSIGSRINRVVARAPDLVFDPPPFAGPDGAVRRVATPDRPIRLIFMGYNNYYKGLHIFVEALEMLTPEYLGRLDVSIFALDGKSIEWMFRRMEPRLAKLTFVCGYNYHDIPWMLGGKDLGIVPSVWWDNAPQTVFEFFRLPRAGAGGGSGGDPRLRDRWAQRAAFPWQRRVGSGPEAGRGDPRAVAADADAGQRPAAEGHRGPRGGDRGGVQGRGQGDVAPRTGDQRHRGDDYRRGLGWRAVGPLTPGTSARRPYFVGGSISIRPASMYCPPRVCLQWTAMEFLPGLRVAAAAGWMRTSP